MAQLLNNSLNSYVLFDDVNSAKKLLEIINEFPFGTFETENFCLVYVYKLLPP